MPVCELATNGIFQAYFREILQIHLRHQNFEKMSIHMAKLDQSEKVAKLELNFWSPHKP